MVFGRTETWVYTHTYSNHHSSPALLVIEIKKKTKTKTQLRRKVFSQFTWKTKAEACWWKKKRSTGEVLLPACSSLFLSLLPYTTKYGPSGIVTCRLGPLPSGINQENDK